MITSLSNYPKKVHRSAQYQISLTTYCRKLYSTTLGKPATV